MAPLVWLITGTSSGIGRALVYALLKRGDKVIATGRNSAERLAEYKDVEGVSVVDLDVTESEENVRKAVDSAAAVHGRIDVVVNNAGKLCFGTVEEMNDAKTREVFEVNVFGVMKVTRAVLPHMRKQKSGTIVMVGSMWGLYTAPGVSTYGATKHALEAYVEALQKELKAFNIRTTIFEPGFIATSGGGIGKNLVSPDPKDMLPEDYKLLHAGMMEVGAALSGNERGDENKLVELMIDLVKGEGAASSKRGDGEWKTPVRMPIGADCMPVAMAQAKRTLKLCEEWSDIVTKIDRENFEGPEPCIKEFLVVPETV